MADQTAPTDPLAAELEAISRRNGFADEFNDAARESAADVPRLVAAVEAALEIHQPFRIWDECGHDHAEDEPDVTLIPEIGLLCRDGLMYEVCSACCIAEGFGQTEDCASSHKHGEGEPICPTYAAIEQELLGEDGT